MNHHPKVKCPSCHSYARWNPRNLKLFNHEDKFASKWYGKGEKFNCKYGGKSIVHWYYEEILNLKLFVSFRINFESEDDSFFLDCYLKRMELLKSKLRYFIENDRL